MTRSANASAIGLLAQEAIFDDAVRVASAEVPGGPMAIPRDVADEPENRRRDRRPGESVRPTTDNERTRARTARD